MKFFHVSTAILATAMLAACNSPDNTTPVHGSGAVASGSSSSRVVTSVSSSVSLTSSSVSQEEYNSAMNAMALSLENAVFVRDLTLDLWEEFDMDAQEALIDVIEVYSDDIDVLHYYVEVAQHEPLTEEELELVFNLMIDIEDAMEILAAAIENLL